LSADCEPATYDAAFIRLHDTNARPTAAVTDSIIHNTAVVVAAAAAHPLTKLS